jgi:N-acetylglutamate synthase-like GNAT family acetyltransferase
VATSKNPSFSGAGALRVTGVARAILARLENAARVQGHTALYLHTGSAVGLYAPLGYTALETIQADTGAGTLTLMRKAL